MFNKFKMINDKLNRFDDWITSKNSRMWWTSIIVVLFWMILFSTVLRGQFDFISGEREYDYVAGFIACLVTIPAYYLFLKYIAKRKKGK